MYYSEIGLGINAYFAYGYLIEKDLNKITELSIGVKIDTGNSTFSILPYEYLEKKGYLNVNEETITQFTEETEIENKTNNVFKYKYVNNETYIDYLFSNYIDRCLFNKEIIYNYLDEEYKQKRFGSFQKFEEFIEANKENYMTYGQLKDYEEFDNMDEYMLYLIKTGNLEVESYQKTIEKEYTQYTCVDNLQNYYIFRETAPMEYTLILDTYTIDLPEFTEKYEAGTTEEKVGYNIEKIVNALNAKDYNYVYSKLADEFKENYFKTYEDFEKYAKETFDIENKVTYNKYTESKDLSTYKITLQGKNKTITKTIVMRLEDGTNFAMSFNVE
ncbi:MAG: hypothetical protein J6A29_01840 [Clostridia bacterium]|nr:hypothetical protein [Clostridia bacterium]